MHATRSLPAVLALALAACQSSQDPTCVDGKCDDLGSGSGSLCAAIRGNGERIPAHFAALARVVEHYGMIDAAAGGSSGSITSFLLESMSASPQLRSCGGADCSSEERAARAGFMLKSLQGYLGVLAKTPEAGAIGQLIPVAAQVKQMGLSALADSDIEAAKKALLDLLSSPDVSALVNPELVDLVTNSPDPAFHVKDIIDSIEKLGSFEADDPRIFLRPGLIDFTQVAEMVGRVGSFYAGYGPYDAAAMDALLSDCAVAGVDHDWPEVAAMPAGDSTCGERFAAIISDYRAARAADPSAPNRVDDKVATYMPLLISTSILEGSAADEMARGQREYRAGRVPTMAFDFGAVKFGYFGRAEDLAKVEANQRGYEDLKTQKFTALGQPTWREILSLSPAEPGLARALELGDGRYSAGGWSDLQPVQALKNLGCDKVVYVTRQGSDSRFAQGIARMLGASDADVTAIFDLSSADSSFAHALDEASGVWCTNWDNVPLDVGALSSDAYNASFETQDPFFTDGDGAYPGATSGLGVVGCTPGAH